MLKIVKDYGRGSHLRIGRRWEVQLITHQWSSLLRPQAANWTDFTFIHIGGELSWYNHCRFEFSLWLLGVGVHIDRWPIQHDNWRWPIKETP